MAFSEAQKLKVKRRCAFQCVRCREIGVEIHHIIPQAEGGPDTDDNAAPLCPNCHTWFGANPEKRKEIRQMRDWWFQVCDEKYVDRRGPEMEKLDELLHQLREAEKRGSTQEQLLADIKQALADVQAKQEVRRGDSADQVAEKATSLISASRIGDNVYANVHCRRCNSMIGLLVGSNQCPTCGERIPN